jgi:hypothetical protein
MADVFVGSLVDFAVNAHAVLNASNPHVALGSGVIKRLLPSTSTSLPTVSMSESGPRFFLIMQSSVVPLQLGQPASPAKRLTLSAEMPRLRRRRKCNDRADEGNVKADDMAPPFALLWCFRQLRPMLHRTRTLSVLVWTCVACSPEPQIETSPTSEGAPGTPAPVVLVPVAPALAEVAFVAAGAFLWDAPPFEEMTFAAAVAHCSAREATLLGNNQWLAEHSRYHGELQVEGVFWSSSASTLDASEAWVVELGSTSGGCTTRPQSERHSVRCARPNPTPLTPPTDTLPGSCDTIAADSECMQHDAEAFEALTPESRAVACTGFAGGTYRREACPADGLVGRCAGQGGQHRHYYERGATPWDEVRARESCRGTFELAEPAQ